MIKYRRVGDIMDKLNITSCVVGDLGCNCYLISKGNYALLVDPGDDFDKIVELIGDKNLVGILITHGHFDHVGALDEVVSKYNVPVYRYSNLDEGEVKIDKFKLEVIYTPGHLMDCVTYYFREDAIMFTGDFLFYDTIGRCDLVGSDYNEMKISINKIKNYADDIVIYPGHGKSTSLWREKRYNPYFK